MSENQPLLSPIGEERGDVANDRSEGEKHPWRETVAEKLETKWTHRLVIALVCEVVSGHLGVYIDLIHLFKDHR
jgi:hypothetical protein